MIVKPATAEHGPSITFELPDGVTISSVDWSIYPVETGGMAFKSNSSDIDGNAVSNIVVDGLNGHIYRIDARANLSSGEKDTRSIFYRIGDLEAVQ